MILFEERMNSALKELGKEAHRFIVERVHPWRNSNPINVRLRFYSQDYDNGAIINAHTIRFKNRFIVLDGIISDGSMDYSGTISLEDISPDGLCMLADAIFLHPVAEIVNKIRNERSSGTSESGGNPDEAPSEIK